MNAKENDYRILVWDDEKIARFWNFAAHWQPWQDNYFSKQVGKGVISFLSYLTPLEGIILDFGCGPGYLVENFLAAHVAISAIDSSIEAVNSINQRFAGDPLWRGGKVFSDDRIPYPDDTFDLVTCVETIEHILPDSFAHVLGELHRIIKPETGRLLITTPNSEPLEKNYVYCPVCKNVYHPVQHVSSFTKASLAMLMEDHQFLTLICDCTSFFYFQQSGWPDFLDWSPRLVYLWLRRLKDSVLGSLNIPAERIGGHRFQRLIGNGPHLFWLGTKN